MTIAADAPSMLHTAGDEARRLADLWWFMLTIAAAVYVLVTALVIVAIRRARRADPEPSEERTGLIWWGGLVLPVIVLGVLAGLTVTTTSALPRDERAALRIDVTGHQWWWDVRYPRSSLRTANELHVPVDRVVDIRLRSEDVIHSFWVPQIAGKLDLIPGQTNHLRVRATRTGTFLGECAEFCGLQHANMRLIVVVQTADDFARWLRSERAPQAARNDLETRGSAIFQAEACAGCHTIRGTQATGRVGPDLTDLGSRLWLAGHAFRNTSSNLMRWISDPPSLKPGVLMPPTHLSSADLRALVAYLESLR